MGLFLGFSFLSIAECIYYAVVRPWRSVREYQNLYKADNRSSRISSSLQRTKTRRSILKKRNRKCLLSPKLLNEHQKLFVKTNRVPYSIRHGLDAPSEDEFRYHYCG